MIPDRYRSLLSGPISFCQPSKNRGLPPLEIGREGDPEFSLWMDNVRLQHFATMVETIVGWCLRCSIETFQGF